MSSGRWNQIKPITGNYTPGVVACVGYSPKRLPAARHGNYKQVIASWAMQTLVREGSNYSVAIRHYGRGDNLGWLRIIDQRKERGPLLIVMPNAAHAFQQGRGWHCIEQDEWIVKSCCLEQSPFTLTLTGKDKREVTIASLGNYLSDDIADIAPSVCMSHLHSPDETNVTVSHDDYARWSCEITTKAMTRLLQWWNNDKCGPWANTAAGLGWSLFRRKHLDSVITLPHDESELCLERSCLYGPKCQPYYIGKVNEPVSVWDIRSMYPYICTKLSVPIDTVKTSDEPAAFWDICADGAADCAADVVIKSNYRTYPVRTAKHGIVYATGKFRTQLAGPELDYGCRNGDVIRILRYQQYKCSPVLRNYQSALWTMRTLSLSNGDGCLANWIKKLQNSLIGKFAQGGPMWQKREDVIPREQWGDWTMTQREIRSINYGEQEYHGQSFDERKSVCVKNRMRSINGQVWQQIERGEAVHSFPAITAWVQSAARIYLQRVIDGLPDHSVLYSDTDSIHVRDDIDMTHYYIYVCPTEGMGSFHLEHEGSNAEYFGWKRYRVGEKNVRSGIATDSKDLGNGKWECWVPGHPVSALSHREHGEVIYHHHILTEEPRNAMGVIGSDSYVTPYVLSDPVDCESPLEEWLSAPEQSTQAR